MLASVVLIGFTTVLAAGEDIVAFDDQNLKQALIDLGADTSTDGEISEDEMAALMGNIDLSSCDISDLGGIEFAVAIDGLNLNDNDIRDIGVLTSLSLTSLDVSNNYLDLAPDSEDMADIAALQTAECTVIYEPQKGIPVEAISLIDSLDMCPGDVLQLTAEISPEDAANKNISWLSSNIGIVSVTDDGLLTAHSTGSASITATTQDGGYTAQCTVKVVSDEITSSKYSTYADKLWFASEGTSTSELKSEIYNDAKFLTVHNTGGSVYTGENVGTGMKLRLTVGGQIRHEVTILTRGDVNGDGRVSITDYTLMRLDILNITDLSGPYALAADLNLNGSLTITDYTICRIHILGIIPMPEAYMPISTGTSVDPTNPNDPGYLNTISNPKIRHFIEIALAQQGAEYVSGNEGPYSKGYDCSGLAYYCLQQAGYSSVYRATAVNYSDFLRKTNDPNNWEWVRDLDKINREPMVPPYWYAARRWPWQFVSAENLQPGDLMFYEKDTDNEYDFENKPIGHVGIYLGNGYHIHASSTYGQVIVSRFEGWYREWFRYGRRINW